MKINKWTLGLAAVGLVSLTPGLLAADAGPAPVPVTTALSATTISGYVDTSAVWNPGTGNANPAPYAFNAGKQDGFNLNSVDVKIAKPLDEGKLSAGYTLELMYGPDAAGVSGALGGSAPIRQAYVEMRANVGNGLDFKAGAWDSPLGFESTDTYKNPNWSESYGKTIEPTEEVGVLASYKFSDCFSGEVGVANNISTPNPLGINTRNISGAGGSAIESKKAIVSLLTLTAPDSWGALKGSALYAGLDYGPGSAVSHSAVGLPGTPAPNSHVVDKTQIYVGATIMTPVKGLTFGAAWDSINNSDLGRAVAFPTVEGYAATMAGYVSYKMTDKLTINGRGEYAYGSAFDYLDPLYVNEVKAGVKPTLEEAKILAATVTLQYDLWDNVISRLEARWDTSADGSPHFGANNGLGNPTKNNELMLAANVIYKF
jgi:hypothetical protein